MRFRFFGSAETVLCGAAKRRGEWKKLEAAGRDDEADVATSGLGMRVRLPDGSYEMQVVDLHAVTILVKAVGCEFGRISSYADIS